MTAPFTVYLNDPGHVAAGFQRAILADFAVAARDWLSHLTGKGSIDFQINIAPTAEGRSESAPAALVAAGSDHGVPVFEAATLHELATGVDVNGAAPDAVITIDPAYFRQYLWIDRSPAHATTPVPTDKIDLTSIFRHEIGHDLGIISGSSSLDPTPGWETTFDAQTAMTSAGLAFVGAHARAAYGGDVPITTLPTGETNSHLGNSLSEPAGLDLMNGVAFFLGTRYEVSPLDLAILEDLGAPMASRAVASAAAPHEVEIGFEHAPRAADPGPADWTDSRREEHVHHHADEHASRADADYHHYWS